MTQSLIDAIFRASGDRKMRMAMLMGTRLESGWNLRAVGDAGQSYGPYQIHMPAHPSMTPAKAYDPVLSTNYMLQAYKNGVNRVPATLWDSDPAMASATAAFYAERPKHFYPHKRIRAAWPVVSKALSGAPVGNGSGVGGAIGSAVGGVIGGTDGTGRVIQAGFADDIVNPIVGFFADVVNYTIFGVVTGFGVFLMAVGVYMLAKHASNVASVTAGTLSAARTVATLGRN